MPARMKLKQNSIEKAILVALIGGAVVLSPMGGNVVVALAKHYLKKWWEKGGPYIPPENDPERVRKTIYKLKRNKYIQWEYNKKKNTITLELTEKGRKVFGQAQLDDVTITVQDNWDGQWRFFMFDIPEKQRSPRDTLRAKLKRLGFLGFQKSVWIYPFECEKEMRYICEYLGIISNTIMFTAKIDNDRTLRRYFLKQGILLRRHLSLLDKGVRY